MTLRPSVRWIGTLGIVLLMGGDAFAQDSLFEREAQEIREDIKQAREPVGIEDYPPSQQEVSADPPWLGSDAGMSDVVLPPWTPVRVNQRSVSVWNRTYRFAQDGLPARITSAGRQLLAQPITVRAVLGGRRVPLQAERVEVRAVGDTKAIVESAGHAANVRFRLKTTVAFDGFIWFELTVEPPDGGAELEELALEIPLRTEHAKLFNHQDLGTSPLRKKNPTLLFANQSDGGRVPAEGLHLPFTAQFSLRDYERGLSWVCQTEKNWRLQYPREAIEVAVKGDQTTLRIHWIDHPVKLQKPLRLAWGLTALPVRPLPDWERYENFYASQSASTGHALSRIDRSFELMDAHPAWASPQPPRETNKPRQLKGNRLDLAKKHGLDILIVHQLWTELQGYPGTFREKNRDRMHAIVREAHSRGLKVVAYLGNEVSTAAPAWETFGAKMLRMPLRGGKGRDDPQARSFRPDANRYYNDFLVHKTRELIREYDIDGVFLDGHPNIITCMNPLHGHGYETAGGTRKGTANVLAARRLIQRLYTLFKHEEKKNGIIIGHSGGPFNPSLAYVDVKLAGEAQTFRHLRNPELKLMDLFSPETFAAIYNPRATGVPLMMMSKPGKGGFETRQTSAVSLLFGVMPRARWPELFSEPPADAAKWARVLYAAKLWRVFDTYDPTGADWRPYWENAALISTAPERIKVSFHVRKGRDALAVVSNPTDAPARAEVRWNLEDLGLNPDRLIARDAMTGEPLDMKNRVLRLHVGAENFRLVLLSDQQKQLRAFSALWRDEQAGQEKVSGTFSPKDGG